MPKVKRNIGQEILEGIRQLKRGEHARVMKVPSVTSRVTSGGIRDGFDEGFGLV